MTWILKFFRLKHILNINLHCLEDSLNLYADSGIDNMVYMFSNQKYSTYISQYIQCVSQDGSNQKAHYDE